MTTKRLGGCDRGHSLSECQTRPPGVEPGGRDPGLPAWDCTIFAGHRNTIARRGRSGACGRGAWGHDPAGRTKKAVTRAAAAIEALAKAVLSAALSDRVRGGSKASEVANASSKVYRVSA